MSPEGAKAAAPKKRSIWRTIGLVVLVLFILGAAGGIYLWQKNEATRRQNRLDSLLQDLRQPQQIALETVAAHAEVKEALGEDIKDAGGLSRDGTSDQLDTTDTVFHFNIEGSKGKAAVTAHTGQKQGAWQIIAPIEVKVAGGKTISVPPGEEKPPVIDFGP